MNDRPAFLDKLSPNLARLFVAVCEHEAAHAVVAHVLGVPVLKVEVLADCSRGPAGLAHTFPLGWLSGGGLRKRVRADLLNRLAGPAANAPALTSSSTADSDFPVSRRLLRYCGARLPGGAPYTIGELLRDARAILRRPVVAAMHEAVTAALLPEWSLGGHEVHALARRAHRRFRRERRRVVNDRTPEI